MLQNSLLPSPETTRGSSASHLQVVQKHELLLLGLTLAFFLAVCLCIQGRYIPWGDEVQFVEPAANLYYKLGFVSREHSNQNDVTFWCGNVPGYSMLLYLAFRTFHFSQAVARVMNDVIMVLAALCAWTAVRRAGLLSQPNTRLLMVVLVLTGYSCYSCYANIRYEGLCLLECALVFLVCTFRQPVIRNICLCLVGAAMVWTNLQLPQYVLVLVLILAFTFSLWSTLIRKLAFLGLGFVAGGASLLLLYASQPGALNAFFITLRQQAGQSVGEKLHDLHSYFEYDASLVALFVFLLASFVVVQIRPNLRARRSVMAGLLICTVIPVFFFLARRFVFSSAWMVYVPAVVCVCQILEARIHESRSWKAFAVICCVASFGFGLPKALAGIVTDWTVRNYAVVDRFVVANVNAKDTVFCEPAAYFAAKPRVARVYGPGYLEVINAAEKQAITVVIVAPENEADVLRDLGGQWTTTRQLIRDSRASSERLLPFSTNFRCRLNVLRRIATT